MGVELPVRHWRLRQQRYTLVGEVCNRCEEKIFPPRDVCPHCGGHNCQKEFEFSGKGTIFSFTTVYEPPAGYEEFVPYTVALVKLDEGPLVTTRLTDLDPSEPVVIGMPVEMVTRVLKKDGDYGTINYGYLFRPRLISSPTEASMSSR